LGYFFQRANSASKNKKIFLNMLKVNISQNNLECYSGFPSILRFESFTWHREVAYILQKNVETVTKQKGFCTVMLTGGRSARGVYKEWAQLSAFTRLSNVSFYMSDERCVSPQSKDSNLNMIIETLFLGGCPKKCTFHPILADQTNTFKAALEYENLLPETIDILLLSVGDDGHIASIFPENTYLLKENKKKILSIGGLTYPHERITITPRVISQSFSTFVMAEGEKKMRILSKLLNNPSFFGEIPARIVLGGTWIVYPSFYGFCDEDKKL
jgi:6-phosphogluconolactonase